MTINPFATFAQPKCRDYWFIWRWKLKKHMRGNRWLCGGNCNGRALPCPLAGLARIALAQGDFVQAQAYIEKVLAYLADDDLAGSDEPFRVYGACCQVLLAANDPRAPQFLTATHERLQAWAAQIPDPDSRRSFLEGAPFHRGIATAFQALQTRK